jgi:hypothetical protein
MISKTAPVHSAGATEHERSSTPLTVAGGISSWRPVAFKHRAMMAPVTASA